MIKGSYALIGSTKFKDTFVKTAKTMSLQGYVTLMPTIFEKVEPEMNDLMEGNKYMQEHLQALGYRRIAMADRVFVINQDGYIGDATKKELAFAIATHRPVEYLEPDKIPGFLDCDIKITDLLSMIVEYKHQKLIEPMRFEHYKLTTCVRGKKDEKTGVIRADEFDDTDVTLNDVRSVHGFIDTHKFDIFNPNTLLIRKNDAYADIVNPD